MDRVKDFEATQIPPDGVLYAGDLNAIQDAAAALEDLTQNLQVGTLAIGQTDLQLLRFGALEAKVTGKLRSAGYVLGESGVAPGELTTTQRNALAAGSRPSGLIIKNTTTAQLEVNAGSDGAPNWQPLVPTELANNVITNAMLQDGIVNQAELATGAVIASKIDGSLKPSVSAAAGTEALRALGTTGSTAAAGNDARLSDTRTPTDGTVTNAKVASGAAIAYSKLALTGSLVSADLSAALQAVLDGKLPLAGGTMTGALTNNSGAGTAGFTQLSGNGITYQHNNGTLGTLSLASNHDANASSKIRFRNTDLSGAGLGELTISNFNTDLAVIVGQANDTETTLSLRYTAGGINKGVQKVTVGVADSGGAGFRVLRVPN